MKKKFYKSKQFWAGIVAIVASIGAFVVGDQDLPTFLLGGNGVIQIVLRNFTAEGLDWSL